LISVLPKLTLWGNDLCIVLRRARLGLPDCPRSPASPPGIPPLASPPHPPPTTPTVPTLPTIEQKSRSPSSVPDEGCNQRSSEVIRGVQAACLMRDAIRGHQRSPRSVPSRRAHHDALTTTRSPRRAHHDALSHFPLRSVLTDALARPAPEPSMAGMPLDHEEEQNTKWESH
jgi:hypothetical protein